MDSLRLTAQVTEIRDRCRELLKFGLETNPANPEQAAELRARAAIALNAIEYQAQNLRIEFQLPEHGDTCMCRLDNQALPEDVDLFAWPKEDCSLIVASPRDFERLANRRTDPIEVVDGEPATVLGGHPGLVGAIIDDDARNLARIRQAVA